MALREVGRSPIWTEKPARFRSLLMPVISPEGLIFSATVPKAKNQSRRVNFCIFRLGVAAAFFASFFLKKKIGGVPFF